MKKLNVIIAAFAMLCMAATSSAQTPQGIKYQAIARTSSGEIIANQQVTFRISILLGSAEGNVVYQEIQPATTNQFGLANLNIGMGNVVSGTFDSIPWGNGIYFAKVEFDPQGGTNFAVMGTSQLLSVPYSLYSARAKVADNMPVFPITAGLLSTNWPNPFNKPATGLLVYNTDSAGKAPYNVIPGYYYNAGTPTAPNWVMLSTANTQNRIADACDPNYNAWGCSAFFSASGNSNTAYGYQALNYNTSNGNVAYGSYALFYDNAAPGNVGVGSFALAYNYSGTTNTAIGNYALYNNYDGENNVAEGANALYYNYGGDDNVANGFNALSANYTGSGNVANGNFALKTNYSGNNNVANGNQSLEVLATGNDNTANGNSALYLNSGGSGNVADGKYALFNMTRSWNSALGDSAGYIDATGTFDTYVGYAADNNGTTTTDATAIGANSEVCQSYSMTFGDDNVTTWDFGTCSPYNTNAVMTVNVGGVTIAYMTTGGSWVALSDRNKKKNFTEIDKDEILNKIVAMPVTQWNYKWDSASIKHIGPMAQDFYKAFQLSDDSLHISTIDEAGVAFAAIQALNKKLETENAALKIEIEQLAQLATKQNARAANDEQQIAEIKALINLNRAQASAK